MKTKLFILLAMFSFSTTFQAQSIEFTSDLTEAEIGSTVTVDYKYTLDNDGYIYCAIELQDGFDYVSTVDDAELNPAPAGSETTGSFTLTIPESTTPASELTGDRNYKIKIELKNSSFDYLTGDFPNTEINLFDQSLSTTDISLQNKVKIFYANRKVNIDGLESSDKYQLSLYDLTGRKVLSFNHQENKTISLPSALYIAKLRVNDTQSVAKKILIP